MLAWANYISTDNSSIVVCLGKKGFCILHHVIVGFIDLPWNQGAPNLNFIIFCIICFEKSQNCKQKTIKGGTKSGKLGFLSFTWFLSRTFFFLFFMSHGLLAHVLPGFPPEQHQQFAKIVANKFAKKWSVNTAVLQRKSLLLTVLQP